MTSALLFARDCIIYSVNVWLAISLGLGPRSGGDLLWDPSSIPLSNGAIQ